VRGLLAVRRHRAGHRLPRQPAAGRNPGERDAAGERGLERQHDHPQPADGRRRRQRRYTFVGLRKTAAPTTPVTLSATTPGGQAAATASVALDGSGVVANLYGRGGGIESVLPPEVTSIVDVATSQDRSVTSSVQYTT